MKKRNKGITLIALVVTIVVLLILAAVSITALVGENGLITRAKLAAEKTNQSVQNDIAAMEDLNQQLENLINGEAGGNTTEDDEPEEPELPVEIETVTDIQNKTVKAKDEYGNIVTVPEGFKVRTDIATKVTQGIVIEDRVGNQFVWIPVGTVYKNTEKTDTSEIKLGRYTFDKTNGTPTMQQAAFEGDNPSELTQTYADTVIITFNSYNYQELTESREGNASNEANATAKNLAKFVESVGLNGGYYLARYEASYGSGYNSNGSDDTAKYLNAKPLSKQSKKNSEDSMDHTPGTLWNFITQLNASRVARNMYAENKDIEGYTVGVESDLVNSYAWDTAVVYLQEMGVNNYANKDRGTNTTLKNTGESGDLACNIYDMAANCCEWTTEYSTSTVGGYAAPYCWIGGENYSTYTYTVYKASMGFATYKDRSISFRTLLYIK